MAPPDNALRNDTESITTSPSRAGRFRSKSVLSFYTNVPTRISKATNHSSLSSAVPGNVTRIRYSQEVGGVLHVSATFVIDRRPQPQLPSVRTGLLVLICLIANARDLRRCRSFSYAYSSEADCDLSGESVGRWGKKRRLPPQE